TLRQTKTERDSPIGTPCICSTRGTVAQWLELICPMTCACWCLTLMWTLRLGGKSCLGSGCHLHVRGDRSSTRFCMWRTTAFPSQFQSRSLHSAF
ncbi:hypothetical protein LPJ60_006514, partial [Coemansia sp. RSA 2675]